MVKVGQRVGRIQRFFRNSKIPSNPLRLGQVEANNHAGCSNCWRPGERLRIFEYPQLSGYRSCGLQSNRLRAVFLFVEKHRSLSYRDTLRSAMTIACFKNS
jgi:hypothetical protein